MGGAGRAGLEAQGSSGSQGGGGLERNPSPRRANLPPVLSWGACFLPSSQKYFSSPQSLPLPILIGKSQVTPAGEKAWLPSEPEHHQQDEEEGDSLFCEVHGAQQLVLSPDDFESCSLLIPALVPQAKVLPEAAGGGGDSL